LEFGRVVRGPVPLDGEVPLDRLDDASRGRGEVCRVGFVLGPFDDSPLRIAELDGTCLWAAGGWRRRFTEEIGLDNGGLGLEVARDGGPEPVFPQGLDLGLTSLHEVAAGIVIYSRCDWGGWPAAAAGAGGGRGAGAGGRWGVRVALPGDGGPRVLSGGGPGETWVADGGVGEAGDGADRGWGRAVSGGGCGSSGRDDQRMVGAVADHWLRGTGTGRDGE
jgi:hypothetical protein